MSKFVNKRAQRQKQAVLAHSEAHNIQKQKPVFLSYLFARSPNLKETNLTFEKLKNWRPIKSQQNFVQLQFQKFYQNSCKLKHKYQQEQRCVQLVVAEEEEEVVGGSNIGPNEASGRVIDFQLNLVMKNNWLRTDGPTDRRTHPHRDARTHLKTMVCLGGLIFILANIANLTQFYIPIKFPLFMMGQLLNAYTWRAEIFCNLIVMKNCWDETDTIVKFLANIANLTFDTKVTSQI